MKFSKELTNQLKLWSINVRNKYDNKCAICGKSSQHGKIDAHHHIPKELLINGRGDHRIDINNGIALCPKHHKFGLTSVHKNYIWFYEWLKVNEPDTIKYLKNKYPNAFKTL